MPRKSPEAILFSQGKGGGDWYETCLLNAHRVNRMAEKGIILVVDDYRPIQKILAKLIKVEGLGELPKNGERQKFLGCFREDNWREVAGEEALRQILKELMQEDHEGGIYEFIIERIEKLLMGIILEEEKGNQVKAARRLEINRNTLRKN